MATDDDAPKVPDAQSLKDDPSALARTGHLLQDAGLPFEETEFDEPVSARDREQQGLDPQTGEPVDAAPGPDGAE